MKSLEPAADEAAALDALLDRLRDDAVRDLAWLLFSPPLLCELPPGTLAQTFEREDEAAACASWLLALDRHPVELRQAIAAARLTRLGLYAECLLAWYLRHGPAPAPRLVAANVALRRAGRTLGECDFLVQTAGGRRLHWELAVKCYLHAGGERAVLADYVGPNLRDRFDLKLAHLLEHQLPLSARDEFASLGHEGPWEAQMFLKGWLFYRWDDASGAAAVPAAPASAALAARHSRGFWVTRGEWSRFASNGGQRWVTLPRLCWLAPRPAIEDGATEAGSLATADALAARLAQSGAPTMVAAFARDAARGQWRERARGFVVPDDWPQRAAAYSHGAHHQR